MRRILLIGGGILAVLGALAAAIPMLIDEGALQPLIEGQLSAALSRPVTIRGIRVGMFPPSVHVVGLSIGEDPAFAKTPFLTAPELRLRVALLPLLQKRAEIQSLRVIEPSVRFFKNRAGAWNVATLGAKSGSGGSSDLSLESLRLEKAKIHLDGFDAPVMTLDLRDTRITGNRTQGSLSLLDVEPRADLRFDVATPGRVDLALTAGASRLTVKGTYGDQPDLAIEMPTTPIKDLAKLAALFGVAFAPGYEVAGSIAISAKIEGPATKGLAQITNLAVRGGDLKQPVSIPKISVTFTPDALRSQPFEAIAGPTRLNGFFSLANYRSPAPRLEATLIANDARLEDLLAMARTYRIQALKGLEGQGRADLQLRLHGAPSALQYNGTARIASAQLRTPSLTKPIEVAALDARFEARSARIDKFRLKLGSSTAEGQANITSFTPPRANLTLAIDQLDSAELAALVKNQAPPLRLTNITTQAAFGDQRLVLSPLNADLYGGKHRGAITIGFAGANPTYAIRSELNAIESSQLLGVITPALRQVISGPLTAQLDLDIASASGSDIARALNGQIKLNFSKGRLLSFNLLDELSTLAKFLRINPQSEKMTSFLALTGDLSIKDGLATTDNLKLDLDKASTTLSGTLGLTDQKLNLRLQTVLTRAYSDEIGGTRIGGYLSSAVANQRGELVLPTLVTGTFGQPRFTPDAGAIAKLKMQNVMQPGSVKENVRGVIDLFKKRPAAPKP